MEKFINVKGYSDIKSFKIFDIDEINGTAKAIEVEKRITPKMVKGGFSAICLNNEDFNKTNEVFIKEGAEAFGIKMKNGVWGYDRCKKCLSLPVNSINDIDQFMKDNPNGEIEMVNGIKFVSFYERTSKGKKKMTFEKLGVLEDECRYYYDFNF